MNVGGAASPTRRRRRGSRAGRLLGLVLILAGLAMIFYWGSDFVAAGLRERGDLARWQQLLAEGAGSSGAAALAHPVDGIDFQLQVPKLGYTAVVREGVGLNVLATGPGRYPTTTWPGQPGLVGVAAHNVFWIQFGDLKPGDDLVLQTRYGTYRYHMTGSRIVTPDDTSVLQPAQDRQLTLTTCWPLWAGEFATRRLAIFARSA